MCIVRKRVENLGKGTVGNMRKAFFVMILFVAVVFGTMKRADAYTFSVGDYYYLQSALNSNLVVDVNGGSNRNGANIQLWKKNGTNAQLFKLVRNGNGYFAFVNKGSDKAIDVYGGATNSGANVSQWEQNGTGAQQWKLYNASGYEDGYIYIVNQCGKYLDVSGGNAKKGTNIQIWDGNGTAAQVFKMVPYVQTSYATVKLGNFSTFDQWKSRMKEAEQKTVGLTNLRYFGNGELKNHGPMIVGTEVLEYKELSLPRGNGSYMRVKMPSKVRFKLHKHEFQQTVWFDFSNVTVTQHCTCGERSQLQWEVPYPEFEQNSSEVPVVTISVSQS